MGDSDRPSSYRHVRNEMDKTHERLLLTLEENTNYNRNPQALLTTCPVACPTVGNVAPLQPMKLYQQPQPAPVCEPEPEPEPELECGLEPEAAAQEFMWDMDIMDQDLTNCPLAPMEPHARLYDPNMRVCPREEGAIPMGISEEERMAAMMEFDPFYTGAPPETKPVPFPYVAKEDTEIDPEKAGELACVFGYEKVSRF
uniref:Uncharacterized protein n=1 Tax=Graphocephala atropunctata TaxID=36148 RepID=A0A1B6MEG9_9HEMI